MFKIWIDGETVSENSQKKAGSEMKPAICIQDTETKKIVRANEVQIPAGAVMKYSATSSISPIGGARVLIETPDEPVVTGPPAKQKKGKKKDGS